MLRRDGEHSQPHIVRTILIHRSDRERLASESRPCSDPTCAHAKSQRDGDGGHDDTKEDQDEVEAMVLLWLQVHLLRDFRL